jgi:hypothetical protein
MIILPRVVPPVIAVHARNAAGRNRPTEAISQFNVLAAPYFEAWLVL